MIVYSNTTPFIALASIGELEILPKSFGKVHVAKAVIEECAEGGRVIVPDLMQLAWIVPVADDDDVALTVLLDSAPFPNPPPRCAQGRELALLAA